MDITESICISGAHITWKYLASIMVLLWTYSMHVWILVLDDDYGGDSYCSAEIHSCK